ncbi:hypothetical protein [Brucella anthropi]|uniref:hypothetical protein n=1 Tax=Brucella anthropi TaxID=529 RepID=UPI003207F60C
MATNDANQPKQGRQLALQVTHVLRKTVRFDDSNLSGEVGILPDGAIILRGNAYVTTAYNTGTLNVGVKGGDADEFGSALALNAQAIVAFDDLAIANAYRAQETVVTFARSAAATAGSATIVIEYAVNN